MSAPKNAVGQASFPTIIRILLALQKAGNLSYGKFLSEFFYFYPSFSVLSSNFPDFRMYFTSIFDDCGQKPKIWPTGIWKKYQFFELTL